MQPVRDRDQAERHSPELRRVELEGEGRHEDADKPDHLDNQVAYPGGGDAVSVLLLDGAILTTRPAWQHRFSRACKLGPTYGGPTQAPGTAYRVGET